MVTKNVTQEANNHPPNFSRRK